MVFSHMARLEPYNTEITILQRKDATGCMFFINVNIIIIFSGPISNIAISLTLDKCEQV